MELTGSVLLPAQRPPVRSARARPPGRPQQAELDRTEAGTKSPGTLDTYRSIYRRHIESTLGALRVWEIDTPVVDRVLEGIEQKTVSGARAARIVISGMMRLAARHGAVTVNPVREVGRIEAPSRPKPKSLTADERQQWLDALETSEAAQLRDLPTCH